MEDVIDIYLGLLLVVYYFNSQMYPISPMFLAAFFAVNQQSTRIKFRCLTSQDNERDVERSDPPQPDPESDAEAPPKDPAVLQ